jgi:hypothetical protein
MRDGRTAVDTEHMDGSTPRSDRGVVVPLSAARARRAAGDPHMTCAAYARPLLPLSLKQRSFAEHNAARAGLAASNSRGVFFYRDLPAATIRWLVDSGGEVLEQDVFLRG